MLSDLQGIKKTALYIWIVYISAKILLFDIHACEQNFSVGADMSVIMEVRGSSLTYT